MRGFLNSILEFISASTLTDAEWATISTLIDQSYTLINYNALLGILVARESVSDAQQRLAHYFQAAGLVIPSENAPRGSSDIFIGDVL